MMSFSIAILDAVICLKMLFTVVTHELEIQRILSDKSVSKYNL